MTPRAGDLFRFVLVGGTLALCNLGLLWLLVDRLGWPVLWACTASFVALNFVGYACNKVFTFRLEPQLRGRELLRYYAVMAASLAANLAAMAWLTRVWRWHYLLASLVLTAILALLNFIAHRQLTFRGAAIRVRDESPHSGPLHLLQVSAFFPAHGGGIEAVAGQMAARLGRGGVRVHWMAGGHPDEAAAWPATAGVTIKQARSVDLLEARLGLPAPLWGPASVWALWRAVGRSQCVQVHDYLYMPSLLALLFARLRQRRVVLTQHIGHIPFNSAWPRLLLAGLNRSVGICALRIASQVVFISLPVQQHFSKFVRCRRPPLLIANGVDHLLYRPAPPRQPDQARPAALLFVGRFVEKKGLPLLRRCLALSGVRWTFIGWGHLPPAPTAGHVEVLGRLPAAAIVGHYQQADLLVLPSTGEGFPLVVQEALACGLPVLVSTEVYEAFPDVDARCVFHVELRGLDTVAAAATLSQRLQDLVVQRGLLLAARAHASRLAAQWDWDVCIARYRQLYEAL